MLHLLLSASLAGPNTAMVGVQPGPQARASLSASLQELGAQVQCLQIAELCIAEFSEPPDIASLAALPGVRWAEADQQIQWQAPVQPTHPGPPQDPTDAQGTDECPDLWELQTLRALELPVRGVHAPVVAIQDSGFYTGHEELGAEVVSGKYDYGDSDGTPEICWNSGVPGHGTFIAGLITARDDNGVGRAGLGPEIKLNLQKIADSSGALFFSYAVRAMDDLADGDLGVRVLNYSIAGPTSSTAFTEAVAGLGRADILLVAAAGNCGYANCSDADNDVYPLYPANLSGTHILSVAGSTQDDSLNSWSHYGANSVDIAAPGVSLCSLGLSSSSDYFVSAGTSYAAPLVAAAAALIWEAHPDLSAVDVARVVRASALDVPALQDKVRFGRLDVYAGIQTAVPGLDQPADGFYESRGGWSVTLENRGAEGEALLVLLHPEAVSMRAPEGWTATAFAQGEELQLPDAGVWTATQGGTLVRGTLPEHSKRTLALELLSFEPGQQPFTVRLALSSAGADYLSAPFAQGSSDATGYLAWSGTWSFERGDTGWETQDTGPLDTQDTASQDTGSPEPGGCGGCGVQSPTGSLVLLLGALALLLRRRDARSPAQ